MRYYDIQISNPTSGALVKRYTTHPNGVTGAVDPGALLVELDIWTVSFDIPVGSSGVRVWGISIQDIAQSSDLNKSVIKVFGGMQKGLPLASPQQSGLICQGVVNQAFGNWQDTNMTLDLQIVAGAGSPASPKNVTFNWKKGTPMGDAIKATLSAAMPGYTVNVNVNPKLIFTEDTPGFYASILQFAQMARGVSKGILGGSYGGVSMVQQAKTINVFDGTSQSSPKQIAFNDLIGQITWIASGTVSFKCVMRADIQVGDYVKLPQGQVSTQAQSYSQYRQNGIFNGVFFVKSVHHLGNSRAPSGDDWATVFEAIGPQAQTAS